MTPHRQYVSTRHTIGREVWHFPQLPSTNDYAKTLEIDTRPDGLAIIAAEQTAGRGQYGRVWQSPPDSGLWMTVLVSPTAELRQPVLLTAWVAVAVADWLTGQVGGRCRIKWPNDVLVQEKKICGILVEQTQSVIVGIGLNLRQSRADFDTLGLSAATSIFAETQRSPEPLKVAEELLNLLDRSYQELLAGDYHELQARWQGYLSLLGQHVRVEQYDGSSEIGRVRDFSWEGLELDTAQGIKHWRPEMIRHVNSL